MSETAIKMRRTATKSRLLNIGLQDPVLVIRELNSRSLYHFLQYFWPTLTPLEFEGNWHIELLCRELEQMAYRVGRREPREYDLIVNVPPGTTKTITCSIIFPIWCWTKWHWFRFICGSYSKELALQSAEYCRDLIRSELFQNIYPDINIKEDKDTKTNFAITYKEVQEDGSIRIRVGGNRYSTSVGSTLTGFHGDFLIVDDPLNPEQAVSEIELATANRWCEQTLSTRKTNKAVSPTVYIMQRLHEDDPSGHLLAKKKKNVRHICLPGEIRNFGKYLNPPELVKFYNDDLLDVKRLPWTVLEDMEADLGQYGYAGQVGQNPTPAAGGMFKVDNIIKTPRLPDPINFAFTVRYWDKAGTTGKKSDYTVGVKMHKLKVGTKWLIEDVKRGRWSTEQRELIIKSVAEADGRNTHVWIEQEPGSGGLESVQGTISNLAGFAAFAEKPTGEKSDRADRFSVQVNNGNVQMLEASWNNDFINELRLFPKGTHDDQVDAASGAFNKLVNKRKIERIT